MGTGKDIILVVDYRAEDLEVRIFNCATGEERCANCKTRRANIFRLVEAAAAEATEAGGRVRFIMESTTGSARVKELIGGRVDFVPANVLQMPLPPKAYRRQSDKIDTARMLREDLVRRQTAVKNWISRLPHHETWADRDGLWGPPGLKRLATIKQPAGDRFVLYLRLDRLAHLAEWIGQVEARIKELYDRWPEAKAADAIRGIGMVTAVSVLAHIGPIQRLRSAEELISHAGLAPGHRSSDLARRNGRIGGGGTDGRPRYLLIETATWLQQIPRYRATHQRVAAKRGKDIARIVVARMCPRRLHKMLRSKGKFNQAPAA